MKFRGRPARLLKTMDAFSFKKILKKYVWYIIHYTSASNVKQEARKHCIGPPKIRIQRQIQIRTNRRQRQRGDEYPGIPGNTGHIPVQALVRRDFKYIYWPTHKYEELFHLPSDPYEEHDLARNATFEVTMQQELRSEFKKVQADAQ